MVSRVSTPGNLPRNSISHAFFTPAHPILGICKKHNPTPYTWSAPLASSLSVIRIHFMHAKPFRQLCTAHNHLPVYWRKGTKQNKCVSIWMNVWLLWGVFKRGPLWNLMGMAFVSLFLEFQDGRYVRGTLHHLVTTINTSWKCKHKEIK